LVNESPAGGIVAGQNNCLSFGFQSFIGGGCLNKINSACSVIGGGCSINIQCCSGFSTIVGGENQCTCCAAFSRTINAFIGGGAGHRICSSFGAIVGGGSNRASGYAFVGGGSSNTASGSYSGVISGFNNCAIGGCSIVLGGENNIACCTHSIAFGLCARACGTYSGAFGCAITATDACTYYFNNVCSCAKLNGLTQFNRQTASYALVLADSGKTVEMNVGSGNNICVPACSQVAFPIGTCLNVTQYGAGQTTVCACSGVTFRSANSWTKINAQYGAITLVKVAADEWYIFGNLAA